MFASERMAATSRVLGISRDQRRERIIFNPRVNDLPWRIQDGFSLPNAHAGRPGIAFDVAVIPIGISACAEDGAERRHVC
jgi:hypothetical protein